MCPLCGNEGTISEWSNVKNFFTVKCSICGKFGLDRQVLQDLDKNYQGRINCLSETLNYPGEGVFWHWNLGILGSQDIAKKIQDGNWHSRSYEQIKGMPIVHAEKPINILMLAAKKLSNKPPFAGLCFTQKDFFSLKIDTLEEAVEWLTQIEGKFLELEAGSALALIENLEYAQFFISALGWEKINELAASNISNKVFLAQSFTFFDKDWLFDVCKKACGDFGFELWRADSTEYNDGIVDNIKSKINESAFLICDLTDNKNGVYWEAGYAEGLGRPVIYTVQSDHLKGDRKIQGVHFDIQHLNLIKWKKESNEMTENIYKRLLDRIGGAIQGSKRIS